MQLAVHSTADTRSSLPEAPGQTATLDRKSRVPYIATWSSEQLESSELVDRGSGIGYVDEVLADRDERGVLWQRRGWSPGVGRPLFGQVHPLRQRRVMRRLLCSICAGPADCNDEGWLWLLRDFRYDWPHWPNGMGVIEPPVCWACAHYSVRACPALREGWVAVRVGHSVVAGVYGGRYRAGYSGPVAIEDATVPFDDPVVSWVCAAQLVREITKCKIVDLVEGADLTDPFAQLMDSLGNVQGRADTTSDASEGAER